MIQLKESILRRIGEVGFAALEVWIVGTLLLVSGEREKGEVSEWWEIGFGDAFVICVREDNLSLGI